jgi:hypothetical protein
VGEEDMGEEDMDADMFVAREEQISFGFASGQALASLGMTRIGEEDDRSRERVTRVTW